MNASEKRRLTAIRRAHSSVHGECPTCFLLAMLDEAQREAERLQQALNGYVPDAAKPRDPGLKSVVCAFLLLFTGCQTKTVSKIDGSMYLNGPAYADYMDLGSDYGHLFKPPFHYYQEVYPTTNGYRITAEGLLRYGVMSGWRDSGLVTK